MTYDEYIAEWKDRRVTKYDGQCVAGIAEFEAENNLPIVWGEKGAVLWINNPIMLTVYDWIWNNPNDGNQLPARGDIVVWDGNTPYTEGSGHIAFFDQPINSKVFMSFGQNSGGPTMHFAQVHWAHVAGWYHRKQPTPPPAPVGPPFWVEDIPAKQVRANKQPTTKWGLNYDNLPAMQQHPVGSVGQGTVMLVNCLVHHNTGGVYYKTSRDDPDGYNVVDCDDYTSPVPVPPPAAPIPFTKAEEYTILPPAIVYFGSAQDALFDQNALGQLNKGTYKVIARDRNMINLTTKYPDDQGKWINPSMNVLPEPVVEVAPPVPVQDVQPTPEPWRPVYVPLRADHQPIVFKSVNAQDYPIVDYSTGRSTIYMPPHHTVKAVDKFSGPNNGAIYYRSESMAAEGLGYGIPRVLLQEAVFDTALTRAERLAMKSASIVDKAYLAWIHLDKNMKFLDGIKSVFAGINQGKRK